jgi:hypothetical protein
MSIFLCTKTSLTVQSGGYLLMVIIISLLAIFGKLFCNSIPLIIGNVISVIISFYFINKMTGIENWDFYFKPLTPSMLLILVSVLNLIPQLLAIKIAMLGKNLINEFINFCKKRVC